MQILQAIASCRFCSLYKISIYLLENRHIKEKNRERDKREQSLAVIGWGTVIYAKASVNLKRTNNGFKNRVMLNFIDNINLT